MVIRALLVALLGHAAIGFAQSPAPTGDPTVRVQGRVITAADPAAPLPGARVSVVAPDGMTVAWVTANREGGFELFAPARGDWSLRATKAGYAPLEWPAASLEGRPVLLRMIRGAVITGRVVDHRGDPVPGVSLQVSPEACTDPCPSDTAAAPGARRERMTATDDRGEYRVGSLPAGRYELRVMASGLRIFTMLSAPVPAAAVRSALPGAARAVWTSGRSAASATPPAAVVTLRAGEETTMHLVHDHTSEAQRRGMSTGFVIDGAPVAASRPSTNAGQEQTGTIRGRVIGPSGNPLGEARVQLLPIDGGTPRVASTNAEGLYDIANVPAGAYRLSVTRTGFTTVQYGQQHAQQQGTTLVLRSGETLERIDVRLPPGGIITGRVVDAYGEPLEGVAVWVLQSRFSGGRTLLTPASVSSQTDDRGQYRLRGLLPGTYFVVASPREDGGADRPVPLVVHRDGSIQLVAESLQFEGTSQSAHFTFDDGSTIHVFGDGVVQDSTTAVAVYHPGTPSPRDAVPVRIDAGFDGYGIDITLAPAPGARVRGMALDSTGAPAQGMVSLQVSHRSGDPIPPPRRGSILPDGSFEFAGVPPGDYVVNVAFRRMLITTAPGAQHRPVVMRRQGEQEYAAQLVTVSGDADVSVSLRASPATRAEGRLTVEDDGSAPSPASFRIDATPADPDRSPAGARRSATPGPSGTFTLPELVGPQRLTLGHAPNGWYLKSALVNGIDATDYPVSFDGAAPGAIVATVARGGDIAGTVFDERRDPVRDYSIVVFPTDASRWSDHGRRVTLARSAHDGTFTVASLPPGEYWVAAIDRLQGDTGWGEWQDPAFLGRLVPGARRVSVAAGQTTTADPRLTRMIP